MDHSPVGASKMISGTRDQQTVGAGGTRGTLPKIAGVQIVELGNVLTAQWQPARDVPQGLAVDRDRRAAGQLVHLNASSVTDWHRHALQTDHLVGVGGTIRLALWDGREASPTHGASEVIRLGALRPVMVIVPPGVWHALRNESGDAGRLPQHGRRALRLCAARQLPAGAGHARSSRYPLALPAPATSATTFRLILLTNDPALAAAAELRACNGSASTSSISARPSARRATTRACRATTGASSRRSPACSSRPERSRG